MHEIVIKSQNTSDEKTLLHFQTDRHKMCNLITSPLFVDVALFLMKFIFPLFEFSKFYTINNYTFSNTYNVCLSFLGKIVVILAKAKYYEWAGHAHQEAGWTLKYERNFEAVNIFAFSKKVSWCYQKNDHRIMFLQTWK